MKKIIVWAMAAGLFAACKSPESRMENTIRNDTTTMTNPVGTDTTTTTNVTMIDASSDDAKFIKEAEKGNYAEVKMAQVALQKSTNNEVRQIALMLEKDHSQALDQIRNLATSKSLIMPAIDSADVVKDAEKYSKKNLKNFDKDWCREMSNEHQTDIRKFEKAANDVKDADLKNWITVTLPTLRRHYDDLEACRKKLD